MCFWGYKHRTRRTRIEGRSDAPLYPQIAAWLKRAIVDGAFPAGERLPSIRELALRLEKAAEDAADGPAPLEYLSFQDYASRQALFADESVTGVKCPVCGTPLAMQRWVNQGDRRYMSLGACPEHGQYLVRIKLRRTEDESWSANRMIYEADEAAQTYYKTKSTQSRRRSRGGRRRGKRKKAVETAPQAETT